MYMFVFYYRNLVKTHLKKMDFKNLFENASSSANNLPKLNPLSNLSRFLGVTFSPLPPPKTHGSSL